MKAFSTEFFTIVSAHSNISAGNTIKRSNNIISINYKIAIRKYDVKINQKKM